MAPQDWGTFLQGAVGGTLFLAAATKLANPAGTQLFLASIGISANLSRLPIIAIVVFEAVLGTTLITLSQSVLTAALAAALSILFVAVIGYSWARGVRRACHCFGDFDERGGTVASLLRAIALLAATAWLLAVAKSAPFVPEGGLGPSLLIIAGAGAAMAVAVLISVGLGQQVIWFQAHRARPPQASIQTERATRSGQS